MNKLLIGAALAVVLTLAVLGSWLFIGHSQPTGAAGEILVALDMDALDVIMPTSGPGGDDVANNCPGNGTGNCTLGTIDTCINVNPGQSFVFDVILESLPLSGANSGLGGGSGEIEWGANVSPPEVDVIDITARSAISAVIHLLQQAAGSGAGLGDPLPLPVATSPYVFDYVDTAVGPTDEVNPPWTHGTLGRYTATVSGTAAPGLYKLDLDDPTVAISSVVPQEMCSETVGCIIQDGSFAVAPRTCPPLADVKKVDQALIGAPTGDIEVSQDYFFTMQSLLHNNGPESLVLADGAKDQITVSPPAGVTISYAFSDAETVTINGVPVPGPVVFVSFPDTMVVSYPVALPTSVVVPVTTQWDLHCTEASTHTVTWQNQAVYGNDPVPGNNGPVTGSPPGGPPVPLPPLTLTVNCTAKTDLKMISLSTTGLLPALKPPMPYPTIYTDLPTAIGALAVAHNNGPYDIDVTVNVTKTAMLLPNTQVSYTYVGMTNGGLAGQAPNGGCVVAPALTIVQATLEESAATPLPQQTWTVTCTQGGIELDDDGDGFVDEDRVNGVNDDGDSWPIADGPAEAGLACANFFDDDGDFTVNDGCGARIDEDSPYYFVNILLRDSLALDAIKDPHVSEALIAGPTPPETLCDGADTDLDSVVDDGCPNIANNVKQTVVTLAVIRPFDPSFEHYMTATATDAITPAAPDNACIQGMPCKTQAISKIPWNMLPTSGWFGDGQPLGAPVTIVGAPAAPPGAFTWAPGTAINPNGVTVGNAGFLIKVSPVAGGGYCTTQAGGSATLYDACLPPPGYAGFTGFVPEAGCAINAPDPASALAPPAAFTSWSSALDAEVALVRSGQPTAYLWARYSAVAFLPPSTYVPANILIFDLSGGAGIGPWLEWVAIPLKGSTPGGIAPCTPFLVNTVLLGQTSVAEGSQDIKSCNILSPNAADLVIGAITRADIGETDYTYVPFSCLPPATDVFCDLPGGITGKDETPEVGINVLDVPAENVAVEVHNGAGPTDISVDLSLLTPLACPAVWLPAYSGTVQPPIVIGLNQISRMSFQMSAVGIGGMLSVNEIRTATVTYQADDCQAGSHTYQIVANVMPKTVPDPDHINNQCENNPVMTASDDDVDDDTVVNWVDNCPYVVNPDQANADGDALGDACDPDDDNDGIDDVADACPTVPEDVDGEDDADGCPDSDAHDIAVVKDDNYNVDVSVDAIKSVSTTIVNGNFGLYAPKGMHFTELLISDVSNPNDKCEARWIPRLDLGDQCVEDVINGKLFSQCEVTIFNVPPYDPVTKTRDYRVHCNERSTHTIFLEESAVPALPVVDPNVQNGNVHKQNITINSFDRADIKELTYVVHEAPASLQAGVAANVVLKKVLHNNGPHAAIQALVSHTITKPDDCVVTLTSPVNDPYATPLPVSSQVAIFETWSIKCTNTSTHAFSWANTVTTNEFHLRDPNLQNNSGSTSWSANVIGQADVSAVASVEDLDFSIDVSENDGLTLRGAITNAGAFPVTVQVTVSGTAPADCTLTPNSATQQVLVGAGATVNVDVAAILHCTQPSSHTVTATVVAGAPKDAHVTDPDAGDRTDSGEDTVAVLATADIKVMSQSAPDNIASVAGYQIIVQPSVPEVFNTSAVLHNNGPFGPVSVAVNRSVDSQAALCTVTPLSASENLTLSKSVAVTDSDAWTVHWIAMKKPPYSCYANFTKEVDGAATHISDPNAANDSNVIRIDFVRDTDGDGVVDNYGGIRDNCQDVPNPAQTDSDGDGLGDVCDDTPTHEVDVKHCFKFGPAPANLSDTTGRYMWAICEIGNEESYIEGVTISMDVTGTPAGCTQTEQLILPGQETFLLNPGEQKWVLYRMRYECHAPAAPGVYNLDVKFCADPQPLPFDDDNDGDVDEDGTPADGIDDDGDSLIDEDPEEGDGPTDCHEQPRQLIVHNNLTNLRVDDDKVQCPDAQYTTINAAVAAATSGTTIEVCAGTYNEQVLVEKSNLNIWGHPGAIVKPSYMNPNSVSLATGSPIAAVMVVNYSTNVAIQGLVIDGSLNGMTVCSDPPMTGTGRIATSPSGTTLIGIYYRNASGWVLNNEVKNLVSTAGCNPNGIFVQSGLSGTSNVVVQGNNVYNYGKNGITANEVGTTVLIEGNTTTGRGSLPLGDYAQNGIQLGFGAVGTVEGNTSTNHLYGPCVSVSVCPWVATGILLYDVDNSVVDGNTVSKSQCNICESGDNNDILNNNSTDARVYDGISIWGNGNELKGNVVSDSDEADYWVDGNTNKVCGNTANDTNTPVGIQINSGTGNISSAAGNTFGAGIATNFVNAATGTVVCPP